MSTRVATSQAVSKMANLTANGAACGTHPRTVFGVSGEKGGDEAAQCLDFGGQSKNRERQLVFRGLTVQCVYALIDAVCVFGGGTLAFALFHASASPRHFVVSAYLTVFKHRPLSGYGGFLLLYAALILLFCGGQELYRTPRTRAAWREVSAVIKSVSFATLVVIAFIYLTGVNIVSAPVVMASFLGNITCLSAWRYAKRRLVIRRVETGIGARNALIVGGGVAAKRLAARLKRNKLLGYRFVGFVTEKREQGPQILGGVDELSKIFRSEFVDEVFLTLPLDRNVVTRIAVEAKGCGIGVKIVPELYDGLAWNGPFLYVDDLPVLDLYCKPIPVSGLLVKRMIDVSFSTAALILCLPLLVLCAVWIKIDSEGPIFYRSRRAGRKGIAFHCYKLRTMVMNADELKEGLRHRNQRRGPFFKIDDDPRITRAGKFLRKYSLDELPQLWNVLRGEMSLVGPRPHPLDDYARYGLDELRRLEVKPGMTGLWQVTARRDPSFETNLALDLKYIEKWNLLWDFRLLLRTVPAVLRAEGQ